MKYKRTINKSGGGRSYTINVPPKLIKELKWREKQKVIVKKRGEGILISDWKPKKSSKK